MGYPAYTERHPVGALAWSIEMSFDEYTKAFIDQKSTDPQTIIFSGYKADPGNYAGWKHTIVRFVDLANPNFFERVQQLVQELRLLQPQSPTLVPK